MEQKEKKCYKGRDGIHFPNKNHNKRDHEPQQPLRQPQPQAQAQQPGLLYLTQLNGEFQAMARWSSGTVHQCTKILDHLVGMVETL